MGFWIFGRRKKDNLERASEDGQTPGSTAQVQATTGPTTADSSAETLANAIIVRERMAKHAVRLRPANGETRSHIGGNPLLPKGFSWPYWKGQPLQHLVQIDLAELWAMVPDAPGWLPRTGLLSFFYDSEQSTWGFDPDDLGSWRVFLDDGPKSVAESQQARDAAKPDEAGAYPKVPIEFAGGTSYPSEERLSETIDLSLLNSDDESTWEELTDNIGPDSRIGGYPHPVQGDTMELECQLASNGIFVGEPAGYNDTRAASLMAGAADWRLLLQLDSNSDAGMEWGDGGRLYFWIREEDARARDFSKVWMVLQCH